MKRPPKFVEQNISFPYVLLCLAGSTKLLQNQLDCSGLEINIKLILVVHGPTDTNRFLKHY